jgi:DnaJ-class molecular chaperone
MGNHYQTLSIPQSATLREIKTAYRRLCLETHPDLHSSCTAKAAQFKRINEAYAVLSCEKGRRAYDFELRNNGLLRGIRKAAARGNNNSGNAATAGYGASFGASLPRNVLIGSLLGIAGASFYNRYIAQHNNDDNGYYYSTTSRNRAQHNSNDSAGKVRLVEAFYNPKTKRYEKPRPWDREYQLLKPEVVLVKREEVHDGR